LVIYKYEITKIPSLLPQHNLYLFCFSKLNITNLNPTNKFNKQLNSTSNRMLDKQLCTMHQLLLIFSQKYSTICKVTQDFYPSLIKFSISINQKKEKFSISVYWVNSRSQILKRFKDVNKDTLLNDKVEITNLKCHHWHKSRAILIFSMVIYTYQNNNIFSLILIANKHH
jgi:hypothetical protein